MPQIDITTYVPILFWILLILVAFFKFLISEGTLIFLNLPKLQGSFIISLCIKIRTRANLLAGSGNSSSASDKGAALLSAFIFSKNIAIADPLEQFLKNNALDLILTLLLLIIFKFALSWVLKPENFLFKSLDNWGIGLLLFSISSAKNFVENFKIAPVVLCSLFFLIYMISIISYLKSKKNLLEIPESDVVCFNMLTILIILILRDTICNFYIFFCIISYISVLFYIYIYKTITEDWSCNELDLIPEKQSDKLDIFLTKTSFLKKIIIFSFKKLNIITSCCIFITPLAFAINDFFIDIFMLVVLADMVLAHSIIKFFTVRSLILSKLAKKYNFCCRASDIAKGVIVTTTAWAVTEWAVKIIKSPSSQDKKEIMHALIKHGSPDNHVELFRLYCEDQLKLKTPNSQLFDQGKEMVKIFKNDTIIDEKIDK